MASTLNASNSGAGGLISTADASGVLQLQTASTTAVTIDTSQNVTFSGNTTVSKSQAIQYVTSTTGTNSVYTHYTNTGGSAYVGLNNSTGGDFGNSAYGLQVFHGGAYPIVFSTNATERMRIDSSGNCFWNGTSIIENTKYNFYFTSSTNGIGSKTDTTSTSYHVRWHNPNGVVGGVYTNGSNTTYTTSSDYRLKENITPMTGALDKVMQLNPVTYTWKLDGSNGQGFIAHELQAIVPECVGGEKDAVNEDGSINPQGIDTSFLVATLTAAIQEQQTIINDLKARIETLEAK